MPLKGYDFKMTHTKLLLDKMLYQVKAEFVSWHLSHFSKAGMEKIKIISYPEFWTISSLFPPSFVGTAGCSAPSSLLPPHSPPSQSCCLPISSKPRVLVISIFQICGIQKCNNILLIETEVCDFAKGTIVSWTNALITCQD